MAVMATRVMMSSPVSGRQPRICGQSEPENMRAVRQKSCLQSCDHDVHRLKPVAHSSASCSGSQKNTPRLKASTRNSSVSFKSNPRKVRRWGTTCTRYVSPLLPKGEEKAEACGSSLICGPGKVSSTCCPFMTKCLCTWLRFFQAGQCLRRFARCDPQKRLEGRHRRLSPIEPEDELLKVSL